MVIFPRATERNVPSGVGACGPFPDHPKAAAKARIPKAAPEFGAVAAATRPFPFQTRKPGRQTALTKTEHILALATHDPPNQSTAQAGCADDPFDGGTLVGHLPNHPVGRLTTLKAFDCSLSAAVSRVGSSFSAPTAFRMAGMLRCTAKRNAELPFSSSSAA